MGILALPNEIFILIGERLSIKDLTHFVKTCRRLRDVLTLRLHQLGVQEVDGISALRWAVEKGYAPLAQIAIERGADVHEADHLETALGEAQREPLLPLLHLAARNGKPDVIRVLAENGAGINVQDLNKRTPLHHAAAKGHVEAVEELLERGADMYCTGGSGNTPGHDAATWGHVDCVRAFVNKGFDFKAKGLYGGTILHAAVGSSLETVHYILQQGEGRSIIDEYDDRGATPLHYALRNSEGGEEKIRLLLHYGADTGLRDLNGWTAVRWAEAVGWGGLLSVGRGRLTG